MVEKKMNTPFPRPTEDKFQYDLNQLPSTFLVDFKPDVQLFEQKHIALVRMHKHWLRREKESAHHSIPCLPYPLTSGEWSIVQIRKSKIKE
jgi:hypothetical protein